jgi:hypothetical protein
MMVAGIANTTLLQTVQRRGVIVMEEAISFYYRLICSVADPGCLFRILIFTHPGSRIQKQQQPRGVKKNLLSYLFCSHKFHKIGNYLIFEMLKKKLWANCQRIVELFAQKIVTKLSKIWV